MTNLTDISARLTQQFLDPQNLAVPVESQEEAVRSALTQLNHFLGKSYLVEGLDDALTTTLPEDHVVVLLFGAGAFALDFCLRRHVSSFTDAVADGETLRLWSEHLLRQFDAGLERLRRLTLQVDCGIPYGTWVWQEPAGWKADKSL